MARNIGKTVAAMRGRVLTAGTLASAAIAVHRTRCSSALSSQAESGHERRVPRTIWEQLTKPPRFDAKSPSRFDLDSYAGRSLHFLDALGDITTLVISGEKLREQQKLLESHAAGEATGATDAELWHARKLCASSIHPETGKESACAAGHRVAGNTAYVQAMLTDRTFRAGDPGRFPLHRICAGQHLHQLGFDPPRGLAHVVGLFPVAEPDLQRGC